MPGMYSIKILQTLSLPSKDFPIEKWLLKIPILYMLYVLSTATITPKSPVLLLLHITYAIKLYTAANHHFSVHFHGATFVQNLQIQHKCLKS